MKAFCTCGNCRALRERQHAIRMKQFDKGVGGGVDRDKLPPSDFAGPGRTYPIVTPKDVTDASRLIGKAGNKSAVKSKIKAIANRKGPSFQKKIPDSWQAGDVAMDTAPLTQSQISKIDVASQKAIAKGVAPKKSGHAAAAPKLTPAQKAAAAQQKADAKAATAEAKKQATAAAAAAKAAAAAQTKKQAAATKGAKVASQLQTRVDKIANRKPQKINVPAPPQATTKPGGTGDPSNRAPNGEFAPSMADQGARRMDWMPEGQYQQMQKGLKKAKAARRKEDKVGAKPAPPKAAPPAAAAAPAAPQQNLLKQAPFSSAAHPSAGPVKAAAVTPTAQPAKPPQPVVPKSTLKIESKPDGMKIHVSGKAAKAAPGAVRHIVDAIAPHMSEGGCACGDNCGCKQAGVCKCGEGCKCGMPKGAKKLTGEPVIDNRRKKKLNPMNIHAPKGSAPAPLKSIGPIHVTGPSSAAPSGGAAGGAAAGGGAAGGGGH